MLDLRTQMLAALLYAGEDCVLSHASAAAIWGLAEGSWDACLTQADRQVRSRAGIQIHRVHVLDLRDVALKDGLPVTGPARTAIDFASVATEAQLTRALAQGLVARLLNERDLLAAMDRCPGRTGIARLRRLLHDQAAGAPTRSEAERLLLRLVADADLPRPEVNIRIRGFEVDFVWRAHRLIVEVDGFQFHGSHPAFEADRRRDQQLAAAGYRVIRITWRQLVNEPMAVAVRIAQTLAVSAV